MSDERVFLDMKIPAAQSSGYFVRCQQLRNAIERIEGLRDCRVIGIVYDGANTIELILDPPLGDDEE